ncbi:DUF485 domain-containing protein [Streptomyces pactum]|uniref:DUF485 domain-containing protein n=1 Tax=Streptomyces pactum TaxID=68249 RepID=UPI0037008A31
MHIQDGPSRGAGRDRTDGDGAPGTGHPRAEARPVHGKDRAENGPRSEAGPRPPVPGGDVHRQVRESADFPAVCGRYRRFVLPATAAFLLWYLAYVVAATGAPGLMAHPAAGALNVAMVAGIAQFATTFLLTWAYARHARLHRDRVALELRWLTQEMTRERGR